MGPVECSGTKLIVSVGNHNNANISLTLWLQDAIAFRNDFTGQVIVIWDAIVQEIDGAIHLSLGTRGAYEIGRNDIPAARFMRDWLDDD